MSDRTKEIVISECIYTIRSRISELTRWLPVADCDYADLCAVRVELDCLIERIEAMEDAEMAA